MKQIIIGQKKAYASGVDYFDLTKIEEGVIGFFNPATGELISDNSGLGSTFAIVCGRGEDKMPIHFPDVNVRTLSVTKAVPEEGTAFQAKFTVPVPTAGKDYTVIVSKKGVYFNERNNWTFSVAAKNDLAASVAAELVKRINANNATLGVKASNSGAVVTLDGVKVGEDFAVTLADELIGFELDSLTEGKKAILDKAYVQDMASRCAAGKGFNDVYHNGDSIYPGYPEKVEDCNYVMYSLRFAVPRVAAKQRDEVVYQMVHIVVPEGSDCIDTFDSILNIPATTTTGGKCDILDVDCGHTDINGDGNIDHEDPTDDGLEEGNV